MLIEFIKENKKLIIVIIIFLVILLLFNTLKETKDKNKVDNSENYVYTYKEKNNSKLPYINLYSDDILNINLTNLEKYLTIEKQQSGSMTYQYYQSDNILSLLVHILDNEGNIDMITYNININEKRNIEESELLHHYNLNKSNIINTIETNVKKYYQYEKSKHYIESSCDLNCYKEINKIDTTTNYHLYVMNNELYIYKRFQTTPNFLYDSNLPFTPFHFKVN